MIDPHVHCRDGKQRHKETIEHAFEIAKNQGIEKIFDMPNTNPPIIEEEDLQKRLELVPKEDQENYFLYMGATKDPDQLQEVLSCYDKYEEVIGIKMYAGESVGDLSIPDKKDQEKVYQTLSKLGYKGVLAVHCEKESFFKPELWNPQEPITHSYTRPKEAEIESIKNQLELAKKTNFQGVFHVVHTTTPESIDLLESSAIKTTCGSTPHHLLWSDKRLKKPCGLLYKTNPPLRDKETVLELQKYLKQNKIDWIETDHAPHPIGEKIFPPYNSGFPSLYLYKDFAQNFLPNLDLDKNQIKNLTHNNIEKVFF